MNKMNDQNIKPEKIEIQGWTFRISRPAELPEPTIPLLLLHGHLGNENVMWTLAKPIPQGTLIIAPRAPMKMGVDQYSWHEISPQWPSLETYQTLGDELLEAVRAWMNREGFTISQFDIMGFSQGGVMAYALAILYSELVRKVAVLASFIPQSWMKEGDRVSLAHQVFFIAHGMKDDIVPIDKARHAAEWLEKKNAQVTFCQADTGHRISADCFNSLEKFFSNDR